MSFVPLRLHSGFSYLSSGLTAERIPFLANKLGYRYVGLADKNSLSGFAPFYHACEKSDVKPIFGLDAVVLEGTFSFFALNEEGYRHLLSFVLLASENRLTLDFLRKNAEGLALVYSFENPIFRQAYSNNDDKLGEKLAQYLKDFTAASLGLPYLPKDPGFVSFCRSFATSHSYPVIAFPEISYEKRSDAIVLKIVNAISAHETLTDKEADGDNFLLAEEEAKTFYSETEIGLTDKLALSSTFVYMKKRGSLLHFENQEGLSSEDYLQKLTLEGLQKRKDQVPPHYLDRLNYELGVIDKMGYADYFLIVSDYVNYAKTHGISVGPGRGSAGGSLVAYSLGIVEADPLKYDLMFERFLNPERQSMPDIDVDFSDIRREEVVTYLQKKYGPERVGHVLTTQTIGAKEALRDIGRVYGYEDREIDLIASAIVDDKISLRDDYRTSPQFKKLIDSDKYYLNIVALASKIEGLPRQAGLHAAGVVLNNEPLPLVLPVTSQESVGYVACLEKDYLEEQGFLKMDLLGLRNLTIVDNCLALIAKMEGQELKAEDIPYEDQDSISLIREGKTMGLFQLESPGIKRAISEVKPTDFEDVTAILALFRPGPMESIPSYARRKNGLEAITYLSPELEPVLKKTYGVIVYQEQITQIVRAMAGFGYGQADLFRRAISKKDANKLAALKESFLAGCLHNGKDSATAEKIYGLIFRFANYGFNRSHAVGYAILTCEMAYLKRHYPREFYCAILDSLSTGDAKFKDTISEIKDLKLGLSVPSINRSGTGFLIEGKSLLFPLGAIKGLQGNLIAGVLEEREENGKFVDLFDFATRGKTKGLTLPSLIRFIDAGALDDFSLNRATLRQNASAALQYAEMLYGQNGKQVLLQEIGLEKPQIRPALESKREDLDAEYEALGMMVSGSPLSFYKSEIAQAGAIPLATIGEARGDFKTVGIVKSLRTIVTRKGSQMAFLELYDEVSEASFVLFSEAYAKCFAFLQEDEIVIVTAHKDQRKDGSFLVEDAIKMGD